MMYSRNPSLQYNIAADQILRFSVVIVLTIVTCAGLFYHLFEIDVIAYLPTWSLCPFHTLTGLDCPGCGMTRAMISIGQLKFGAAVGYNLFSVPLFILMILYVRSAKFPSFLQHQTLSILMFILVVFVWLMRLSGMQTI